MDSKHTALRIAHSGVVDRKATGPFLEDASGTTIARVYCGNDFALAEFIVRATNNHEALLAALEKIRAQAQGWKDPNGPSRLTVLDDIDSIAIAAIEAAKEETA